MAALLGGWLLRTDLASESFAVNVVAKLERDKCYRLL